MALSNLHLHLITSRLAGKKSPLKGRISKAAELGTRWIINIIDLSLIHYSETIFTEPVLTLMLGLLEIYMLVC